DRPTATIPAAPPLPATVVSAMRCTVRVSDGDLDCAALNANTSASSIGGRASASLASVQDPHLLGGQGIYVRLVSSGLTYNTGTGLFSFNVTVQNLSTAAMATSDGATRHDNGMRVFFNTAPTTTSGTGTISILNPTGQDAFTGSNQSYYQYGGKIGGVDQGELGADGILSSAEVSSAKNWQFDVPSTVTMFAFTVYVATEMAPGTPATAAPQVSAVSPSPLVPGAPATITGTNFNATPASNAVRIGGRAATVTGGSATQLTFTVPCVSSGSQAVNVTTGGMRGGDFSHPVSVTQRPLAAGQSFVLATSSDSYCNELPAANATARYIVAVFSASTSPASNSGFQLSGDPVAASAGPAKIPATSALNDALALPPTRAPRDVEGERHAALLEENAAQYGRLRAKFGTASRAVTTRMRRTMISGVPPLTRTFRVANINATNYCASYFVVSATRVYYNGKIAIYEDDATATGFQSVNNAAVATAYQTIGDEFNADVEPLIRNNFGDILRRDADTDDNGVEIALFTPRINASFAGTASFTLTCDQFPNDDVSSPVVGGPYTGSAGSTNGSSNFGEVFYGWEATTTATDFSAGGVPYWTRQMRKEVVHESKHIASYSARVANNAPTYEAGWLEESMSRQAEELWTRTVVDNLAWKSNVPYGSSSNPVSVYCESRPIAPECNANPRRPAVSPPVWSPLYTEMFGQNARLLSPFGATASDNARYYYAIGWSLVRYAVDQYGASDAAFLTALTQATTSGVTNLTAQTGT
ncbi:MAG TPA: IPT/TIG domain-containing protein, partial [Gemmatimonadaceae bacterium]|nr:IPT/TIG domain-containing protein [Gemmatimonadaceae bacterium]